MQLSVSGHHIDITDALRDYVTTRVSKLSRHYDHITNVHVVLTVDKLDQIAEATVHAGGTDIFADASTEDLYASIDALVDKLDRQIIKHKEKVADHRPKQNTHHNA